MYGLSKKRFNERLVRFRGSETGDPFEQPDLSVIATDVSDSTTKRLATAIVDDQSPGMRARLAEMATTPPAEMASAKKLAALKDALSPDVLFVLCKNASELNSSVGNGAKLTKAQAVAVATAIQTTPPMPTRAYNFLSAGPDTLEFYPSASLSQANGGPLPIGTQFPWVGSMIVIKAAPLLAVPGSIATIEIQYDPSGPNGFVQRYEAEIHAGVEPTEISLVHAVIPNTGSARLQNRSISASPLPPAAPGLLPKITISGLLTTIYSAQYRPLIPGDYRADRFSRLLNS